MKPPKVDDEVRKQYASMSNQELREMIAELEKEEQEWVAKARPCKMENKVLRKIITEDLQIKMPRNVAKEEEEVSEEGKGEGKKEEKKGKKKSKKQKPKD